MLIIFSILGKPKPRALHKTTSIFLRNLAPTITKQEVEAMCKRYPGFLRAAIADPQPERRYLFISNLSSPCIYPTFLTTKFTSTHHDVQKMAKSGLS